MIHDFNIFCFCSFDNVKYILNIIIFVNLFRTKRMVNEVRVEKTRKIHNNI